MSAVNGSKSVGALTTTVVLLLVALNQYLMWGARLVDASTDNGNKSAAATTAMVLQPLVALNQHLMWDARLVDASTNNGSKSAGIDLYVLRAASVSCLTSGARTPSLPLTIFANNGLS